MQVQYHLLLIAIDEYHNDKVFQPLRGCVKDAQRFAACMKKLLGGEPVSKIQLFNDDATRANILAAFCDDLIENRDIKFADLIIIFYAGHGGTATVQCTAESSSLEFTRVETLCPVDDSTNGTQGIPDVTIIALLQMLARKKGDNIIFVCDSCHSGGIARGEEGGDNRRTRKNGPQLIDLNIDALILSANKDQQWTGLGFRAVTDAYIFLAACGKDEEAYEYKHAQPERSGGYFTSALVDRLGSLFDSGLHASTSYSNLIQQLVIGGDSKRRRQSPEAYGRYVDRLLFTTRTTAFRFRCVKGTDGIGKFQISAGHVHGVVKGTLMTTAQGYKLECTDVQPLSAQAVVKVVGSLHELPSWVCVEKWNAPNDSELHVYANSAANLSLTDSEYNLLPTELAADADVVLECDNLDRWKITMNNTGGLADVLAPTSTISPEDKPFRNSSLSDFPLRLCPRLAVQSLRKIAHFKYHLGLKQAYPKHIKKWCTMSLFRVKPIDYPWLGHGRWETLSEDLFKERKHAWFKIPQDDTFDNKTFELKVHNTGLDPCYLYLFAFDLRTFAITSLHMPAIGSDTACIGPKQTWSYIKEHKALPFILTSDSPTASTDIDISVTYFKLYACSENVNMHHIEQKGVSPTDEHASEHTEGMVSSRRYGRCPEQLPGFWDQSVSIVTYGSAVTDSTA